MNRPPNLTIWWSVFEFSGSGGVDIFLNYFMPIIQDCVFALPDSYGYLKTVRLSLYLIEFFDYQSFQIIFQSDFFLSTSESLLNHGNLYSISHRKNCLKQVFVYDNRQCTFYEHLTVHRVLICNFHDEVLLLHHLSNIQSIFQTVFL